ncbi:hypothetical protein XAC2852_840008 [Xanthomonas citri pv. citri]|nr:hypothetical protein XAC2852_840008 [Xanthomonas citri pv. citri]
MDQGLRGGIQFTASTQLICGARPLAEDGQQLKQKHALRCIGRLPAHLLDQLLQRLRRLALGKQGLCGGIHRAVPYRRRWRRHARHRQLSHDRHRKQPTSQRQHPLGAEQRLHARCVPHRVAKRTCVAKALWLPAFALGLGHTLDVVGEFLRATLGGTLVVLRLEAVLELAEVQRHVFGEAVFATGTAGRQRGNQYAFAQLQGEKVALLAGGVGDVQPGVFHARTGAHRIEQCIGAAIHVLGDGDVLDMRLATAGRAATGVQVAGITRAPRPGQDRDLALVLLVVGCAFDLDLATAELDMHVERHGTAPSMRVTTRGGATRRRPRHDADASDQALAAEGNRETNRNDTVRPSSW